MNTRRILLFSTLMSLFLILALIVTACSLTESSDDTASELSMQNAQAATSESMAVAQSRIDIAGDRGGGDPAALPATGGGIGNAGSSDDALLEEPQATQFVPAMPTATALATNAAMATTLPGTPAPTVVAAEPDLTEEEQFLETYGVNPYLDTATDNLSTFSMDVDTGSYTMTRSALMNYNQFPNADTVRPEEFINYFDVGYPGPEDDTAFAIHMDAAPAPFGEEGDYLFRVGIQGRYIDPADRSPALLIFVIDVSGSMNAPNRLPLVKEALTLLVHQLREDDRVGIVVYSDNTRIVLEPTPASEQDLILGAISSVQSEGSTNMVAGLELGYQMANVHQGEDETTRVILLSDGVANVGVTDAEGILGVIADEAEQGIVLSTIGFGMGDYNDSLMETLADDGDGAYYYVDNLRQARRIFVYELTSTLEVIAFEARIQVEFNPDVVANYRLIGYENRAIDDADFRNDEEVDAAEIGAGHNITALYEIRLHPEATDDALATTFVRYQDAETMEFEELNAAFYHDTVLDDLDDTDAGFRLQVAVAEFSELLRGSYWAEDGSYVDLLELASPLVGEMSDNPEVAEFVEMIRLAGRLVDVS